MTIMQSFTELVHQRQQRESAKRNRPVETEVTKLDVRNLNFFYGEKQRCSTCR